MKEPVSTKKKVSPPPRIESTDKRMTARSAEKVEKIRCRAYEIYEQRTQHRLPGDQISDWVTAEEEVRSGNV